MSRINTGAFRLRQILDSATSFAIIATDRDGLIVDWNLGAERIFGWSASEAIGTAVDRIFTPEDREAGHPQAEMARALADGQAADECWHTRSDDTRFWASGELTPLRDETGRHTGFVKILRNRTPEHLAGRRLERAESWLRQAQEAGGVGVFSVNVADGLLTATPEFSRLYGLEHNDLRPAADFEALVVAEDQNLVSHHSTRRVGNAARDVAYRIRRPDTGEMRWIARRGEFEEDGEGRPARFVGVSRDITADVRARQLLEDERERLAQMFEQAPTFMALLRGPEHRFERVNPGYSQLVGNRDVIGQSAAEALPEVVEQGFIAILDEVYRTGVPFRAHDTAIALETTPGAPLEERFLDFVYQPIRNREGDVTGIFVEGADVTARVAAAAQLRTAERRYRTLFNSIDEGFCVVEMIFEGERAVDYRFREMNEAFSRHTGLGGVQGLTAREAVPSLEEFWFETYGRVAATGEPIRFRHQALSMGERWFEVYAFRLDDPDPNQVGILFSDISEPVAAENQRHLLNQELAHRLKNTLAIVQSITSQTLRSATDTRQAGRVLNSRIQALSQAHDILLAGQRDAADVGTIVRSAVLLHDEGQRIELAGRAFAIGPKAALALTLICHELATNAGKYGALSVPGGRVRVSWETVRPAPGGQPLLAFEWVERDGPRVVAPTQRSFGTKLVEMGLSGSAESRAELVYAPEGVTCRIVAPLHELREGAQPDV